VGWEADRARDHAEAMNEEALRAAEEEAEAYERDRRMTDDYRWSEAAHTFDEPEPDEEERNYQLYDDARYEHAAAAEDDDEDERKEPKQWPAHVVERFRQIYNSLHVDKDTTGQMTPEERFLSEVILSDKNYPPEFNKWYFLHVEQYYKDEGTHGPDDYRKKEAYTKWKVARWMNFYGSQMVEGMPDEVSDIWQDLDRAYDDGNGMFIDPAASNMVNQLKTFRVQGTRTGRFVSPTRPHVSWEVAKRERDQRKVSKREELEKSIAGLRERLEELYRAHDQILQRPSEPANAFYYREMEDGEPTRIPPAIYFKKQFTDNSWQAGKGYDYVFMKAGNGYWYGTGPHAPQKQTWDELMDWMESTGPWPTIYELTAHDGQVGVYWRPKQED
jgi:hypothetical protein